MFGLTRTNDTVFTDLKALSLDERKVSKREMDDLVILAGEMKIAASVAFGSSSGVAFLGSLRTMRGPGIIGPFLALGCGAVSVLSYDVMKVAENVETFASRRTVRISATKSSEIFAGYMTQNARFLIPLYKTRMLMWLDRELPKSQSAKSSQL